MPESGKKRVYTSFTASMSERFFRKTVTFTMSSNGTSMLVRTALMFLRH